MVIEKRNSRVVCELIDLEHWEADYTKKLQESNAEELIVNHCTFDYSILGSFGAQIKHLTIYDNITKDIGFVNRFHNLVSLNVETNCKTPIDFSGMPELAECFVTWRKGTESIFHNEKITKLRLVGCPKKLNFSIMKDRLQHLEITKCAAQSLKDLELHTLLALKRLELNRMSKLSGLTGLEELKELRTLHIDSCNKIVSIDSISNLTNLNWFTIGTKALDSIKPLANLTKLERLHLGSVVIADNDLSPLSNLRSLKELYVYERKTYSPSVLEVMEALQIRS